MTNTSTELEVIECLPVVVFSYIIKQDGTTGFTYVSPTTQQILGLRSDEMLLGDKTIQEYVHIEDWPSFESARKLVQQSLCDFTWEGRLRLEKRDLWISVTGKPRLNEKKDIIIHGVIQDISQRKLLENERFELEFQLKQLKASLNLAKQAQINQSEKKYRSLMEHLSVGVIVLRQTELLFANDHAVKMVGAKNASEVIGKNVMKFMSPDFRELIKEQVKKLKTGETLPPLEEKIHRLDGQEIFVEANAYPFEFNDLPATQVILTDITEKKLREKEARKTEKLFTQLFENSPFAIVMLDEKGHVRRVNDGFETLFGYNGSELFGQSLNKFIVPEELQSEGDSINKSIATSQIVRLETVRQNRDGKPLNVIVYGVPVNLDEQTIGIFGVYVDITHRKNVEEELKVRNAELDNFVYKVSHDLRAPLSSILGLVHLAALPDNTDNLDDYLKLIGSKIHDLDKFITDVLSHSKNLKLDVQVSPINLNELIQNTFSSVSYLKGVDTIKLDVVVRGGAFYSDPWRLSEILRNLISNSVKYRNTTIPNSKIEVRAVVSPTLCHLEFCDNGIGIASHHLAKVFDMFFRAHEKSDGSGLGLYIVKKAVEKLGGSIKMDSQLGVGTRYEILIPNFQPK
jgi:PAS domain S-box-containing protein